MTAIEIVDVDPVVEACDHLWCEDGTVGGRLCPSCDGSGCRTFDRSALFTLSHNLAIAGALTRAFRLGDTWGFWTAAPYDDCNPEPAPRRPWHSNTKGRAAP